MTDKNLFGQPILTIPFELRGDTGMVSLYYHFLMHQTRIPLEQTRYG